MRRSKLKAEEIEQLDRAEDDRRRSRKNGYSLMEDRDRGGMRLSNGAIIEWHVPKERRTDGVCYSGIESGNFILNIEGQKAVFSADEFRKWVRWV